jgi:hypothetical protein
MERPGEYVAVPQEAERILEPADRVERRAGRSILAVCQQRDGEPCADDQGAQKHEQEEGDDEETTRHGDLRLTIFDFRFVIVDFRLSLPLRAGHSED